jgi:hypothetical protein
LNDINEAQSFNLTATSTITSVNTVEFNSSFKLHQNYPNPFNPTTNISFNVEEAGFGSLRIYDVLGNLVETIFSKRLTEGEYSIEYDANNLSSGVYFYKLNVNNFIQTKKMILGK